MQWEVIIVTFVLTPTLWFHHGRHVEKIIILIVGTGLSVKIKVTILTLKSRRRRRGVGGREGTGGGVDHKKGFQAEPIY